MIIGNSFGKLLCHYFEQVPMNCFKLLMETYKVNLITKISDRTSEGFLLTPPEVLSWKYKQDPKPELF